MSDAPFVIPAEARSWVEVSPGSHFPIQNFPLGCMAIEVEGGDFAMVPVSAIGDSVIMLPALAENDLLTEFEWPMSPTGFRHLRRQLFELFRHDQPLLRDDLDFQEEVLVPMDQITLMMPFEPAGFVDFYSGIHHASNVGRMFRPDQPPLLPNYRHLPVAYNGRASTLVPTEWGIERPSGVFRRGEEVVYASTEELDFELELGVVIGEASNFGQPVPIDEAESHVLGVVLVNDWSARDIQRFEYQPLGPFLGKSFATGVGPWMVSLDALEPFRVAGIPQEPLPLPHLQENRHSRYDLILEVALQSQRMKRPQIIARTSAKHLYWGFAQQIAHMTSNGATIDTGDLLASGTISGEEPDGLGSMLELAWRGTRQIALHETGETRSWLQDGDTVIMSGYAQGDGYRIGLGELAGQVVGSENE